MAAQLQHYIDEMAKGVPLEEFVLECQYTRLEAPELLENAFARLAEQSTIRRFCLISGPISTSLMQLMCTSLESSHNALESLEISVITLESITPLCTSMPKFQKLRHLLLPNNKLCKKSQLVQELCLALPTLSSLEDLNLECNAISGVAAEALARSLAQLKNLQSLNLNSNMCKGKAITSLAIALQQLPNLRDLDLSRNGLNDDDMSNLCIAFTHMDGLRSLVLDANKIQMQGAKELAAVLTNIVQLEKLSLKSNKIDVDGGLAISAAIALLVNLRELVLFDCSIQAEGVSALAAVLLNCPRLEVLDLRGNHCGDKGAEALFRVLPAMKNLRHLNIQFNGRTNASRPSLAKAFVQMPWLQHSSGDEDIDEIREYGRLLLTGETTANSLKVYLCGDPRTGKSTLVRSLRGIAHPEHVDEVDERTKGIDVSSLQISGSKYVLWDFAGQTDYHVHHSLFMYPEAAVFLVLFDVNVAYDIALHRLEYWLRYICTQCEDGTKPNVLLLATHIDQIIQIDEDNLLVLFALMQNKFSDALTFIQDEFLLIDCCKYQTPSMQSLMTTLEITRKRLFSEGQGVTPLFCSVIMESIEAWQKNHPDLPLISYGQFERICMPAVAKARVQYRLGRDLDEELAVKLAARHLHRVSSLYYEESGPLGNIVIINMSWLCHDVLGWIFCPPSMIKSDKSKWRLFNIEASKGPVKESMIPLPVLSTIMTIDALELLEYFKLCCCFTTGNVKYVLFPSLLRTRPEALWVENSLFEHDVGIKLLCGKLITMIPPGFFTQLQVSLFAAFRGSVIWQDCIICRNNDAEVFLALSNDYTILIHVRGIAQNVKASLQLLLQILTIIRLVTTKTAGLTFAAHYCSVHELKQYKSVDPPGFALADVISSRLQKETNVVNLDGLREPVARVCGLTLASASFDQETSVKLEESGDDLIKLIAVLTADSKKDHACVASSSESVISPISTSCDSETSIPIAQCPFFEACRDFVRTLGIVGARFDHANDRCYCSNCFKDSPEVTRGMPPKPCVLPVGWARIALKIPDYIVEEHRVFAKYYISYHGTRVELLPSIIKEECLLYPGLTTASGFRIQLPAGRIVDGNYALIPNGVGIFGPKHLIVPRDNDKFKQSALQLTDDELAAWPPGSSVFLPNQNIFTSPSLNYASQYSAEKDDGRGGKIKVAIQLRQIPEGFTVMQGTTVSTEPGKLPVDPVHPNDELEWFTSRLGPVVFTFSAILVKIEKRVEQQSTWL